ncbi:MAG: DUF2637 domain-containing protein, partial [Phycicoccus sp.]
MTGDGRDGAVVAGVATPGPAPGAPRAAVRPELAVTGAASRPGWIVWVGSAVVAAAAVALSFGALRDLAVAVAIPPTLAWLLPVAIDGGAVVACAVWLGRSAPADARRFAGRLTWALLAVTVIGNAGQLGMHAHLIAPPWWVAVLVGAVPPAVLGAVVHLAVLLGRSPIDAVAVAHPPVTQSPTRRPPAARPVGEVGDQDPGGVAQASPATPPALTRPPAQSPTIPPAHRPV